MKNKVSGIEIIKWVVAILVVVLFAVIGSIFHIKEWYNAAVCGIAMSVLSVGLIIGTVVSVVMKKRFTDTIDRENLQKDLLAKREQATEIAKKYIDELGKMIGAMDLCAIAILACVCVITLCFFALIGGEGGGVALPLVMGTYTGLGFIRSRKVRVNEKEQENYLSEKDYPLIYDTAKEAAWAIGCEGRIKIFIDHDFNVGIASASDGYMITVGTYVLDLMSRRELYNIFLHEFGHMLDRSDDIDRISNYVSQLETNDILGFSSLPYIYLRTKFAFEYSSYQYVCSLMNEDAADAAMREHGEPEIASSMLIKLKFFELYDWENGTYDEENIFEPEELAEDIVRRTINMFRDRMADRKDQWIKMIGDEIISRNATHSTVKMRIDSLGIKELRLMPGDDSDEYLAEAKKAILMIEEKIKKNLQKDYKSLRQQNYLASKESIDRWYDEGKPITLANYQNILLDLFSLRKITEFVNVCCQVIEEIPEPGNYFAHHMYGIYLLRRYDEGGIDHLYKATELNHNNWWEAMEHIGRYACVVGKQDQLDKYREKAPIMAKKQEDIYDKMNTLTPKDRLVPNNLPKDMISGLMWVVHSVNNNRDVIDELYVFCKIIDRENTVTCVVVKPKKNANPGELAEVMEGIYQHLDKSSDWQFSLFDMRMIPRGLYSKIKKFCVYKAR